ncbi:glycosyltransferase (plasmid) [Rhizobium sp. 007]|nr:glycosyltransferase [Rhizobium sp. 007]
MRVGYVVGRFPVLSETFVINQMAGLLQRDFEVGVVCNGIAPEAHIDTSVEPLSTLMAGTRDWWGPAAGLRSRIATLPSGLRDKASTLLDMLSVRRLNSFDVIVAHFGQNGARVARLKKRGLITPPIITVFHGYDVGVPFHEKRLGEYRDLFKFGSLNLPVNDYFRRLLIEAGASDHKVSVHRMGIDITQIPFTPQSRRELPLRLISVSRLIEKKGVELALRALSLVKKSKPEFDWRYTIVGDGPNREQLQQIAAEGDITDRVAFTGSLPHATVKEELRHSHVFVLPSVTAGNGDVEGIPVALMEAMAAGLTVVSTHHSGIPELIADRKTGFLAPEKDIAAIADSILWIATHPEQCEQFARNARLKVEREYNAETLNDRFATIVSDIAKAGK